MTVTIRTGQVAELPSDEQSVHLVYEPELDQSTISFTVNIPLAATVYVGPTGGGLARLEIYALVDDQLVVDGLFRQIGAGVWNVTISTDVGIITDLIGIRPYGDKRGNRFFDPYAGASSGDYYVCFSRGPAAPPSGGDWTGPVPLVTFDATPTGGGWPLEVDFHLTYRIPATTVFDVDFGDGHTLRTDSTNNVTFRHTFEVAGSYSVVASCLRTGLPGTVQLGAATGIVVEGVRPFGSVTLVATPATGKQPLATTFAVTTTPGGGPDAS